MKIATWNVNSLQVRLPHVLSWMKSEQPDVLALQETKIQDVNFPIETILDAGYQVVYAGEKSYNGVAIFSKKQPKELTQALPHFADSQKRFLGVTIQGVRILNLYVPNGSEVGSEKFQYKLMWLSQLKDYVKQQAKQYDQLILLGDFNIAPEERDVHDPAAWEGSVLVSEPEREKWRELLAEGLSDTFRLFYDEGGYYSWWDYRMNAFRRNLGLRIDHILVSQALAQCCRAVHIDRLPRTWERPSDHAPVVAEFA
ncbi:MAG: exodeoxyribonuclease III [Gammaproteobacteria bacterium]|nr:exodeoxyribonuclease III [Gammaproteobacteria bacterium]